MFATLPGVPLGLAECFATLPGVLLGLAECFATLPGVLLGLAKENVPHVVLYLQSLACRILSVIF
jgi:hypothetical protein